MPLFVSFLSVNDSLQASEELFSEEAEEGEEEEEEEEEKEELEEEEEESDEEDADEEGAESRKTLRKCIVRFILSAVRMLSV